jgi:hypothetical protein
VRPAVIVGSTAAHLVVLWWIAGEPPEIGGAVHRPQQLAVVAVRESEPIEIAFLSGVVDTPRPTRAATGDRGTHRVVRGARAAVATSAVSGPADEAALPSSSSSASGSALMRMRGAELRLDAAAAERIASADAGGARDEIHVSGRLESQPGGRAVVHDTVTTADVGLDGHVTFRDKPDIEVKARAPMGPLFDPKFRREVRDHVAKWLEDPYEGTRYGPAGDLPAHLQAVPQACDSWGSDWCQDPNAPDFEKRLRSIKQQLRGGVSGKLDITDIVHRKKAGDPYASRKMKLLDETRDERIVIGERFRAQQGARSAELMRRNLERLWARELDPSARREALFELWDECGDDDAGRRARTIVIGWIRARLPRGSEHAFTDDEIADLRARSSSAESFIPYD